MGASAPPAGAAAAAPPTGAEAMFDNNSSMFCPFSAFANIAGQKGSTSFPLALMTFDSLSPYVNTLIRRTMMSYGDL